MKNPISTRLRRQLRRNSFVLLAAGLALGYPLLRVLLDAFVGLLAAGPDQAQAQAIASAQWVHLPGPASKLVLAVWFFAVAQVMAWLALRLTPVLPDWATSKYARYQAGDDQKTGPGDAHRHPIRGFKGSFLSLESNEQRLHFYTRVWQGHLLLFALCLLAAALVQ